MAQNVSEDTNGHACNKENYSLEISEIMSSWKCVQQSQQLLHLNNKKWEQMIL